MHIIRLIILTCNNNIINYIQYILQEKNYKANIPLNLTANLYLLMYN